MLRHGNHQTDGCARSIPPSPGLQQMRGGWGGALRSTLLQWCPEPHHYSPKPPSFPLSQPSCSSTWVQNHEFSKSLKTTQRGNQGARGFQRRAALPCISKSCPIADLTYTHTHTRARTHPQEPELLSRRSLLSPSLPTQLLLLRAGEDSIPRVSHLPSPDPPSFLSQPMPPFPPPSSRPIPKRSPAHLVPVVVGPFRGRPGGFS